LMTYLFQDRDKEGEFARLKQWHAEDPQGFSRLIDRLTTICVEHLDLQITAGASACQVFDSWAGKFSSEMFEAYVLKPMEVISAQIAKRGVPLIYFSRHLGSHHHHLLRLKADGLSVDSTVRMSEVQGENRVVQGNLAPETLLTDIPTIEEEVAKMAAQVDPTRWIANLGHGVLPATPIHHVEKFIELIHALPVDNRRHRTEDCIGVAVGEKSKAGATVIQ
jgi:uroporphyrinogen decarboxylase